MHLCIITCYKQPDYIRAKTLRSAAGTIEDVEVTVIKNKSNGLKRYLEVLVEVIKIRLRQRPDVYLVTFRGYEVLLPVRLLTAGRPLIYDEFIHPMEWLAFEHKKIKRDGIVMKAFSVFYWVLINTVQLVLTDTKSHADLSAKLTRVDRKKIASLPVGTDENTFFAAKATSKSNQELTVLYYGNMLPLHGLEYVIEAAVKLKRRPVRFILVGGNEKTKDMVDAAIEKGANIDYKKWVNYKELPIFMKQADVCLAGPFGNTYQAQYVITGKAYQYLAMARPIIIGENKESTVFTDRVNALVVPQADSSALASAIEWGVDHPNELKALGQEGRVLYEKKYRNDKLSKQLRSILLAANLL